MRTSPISEEKTAAFSSLPRILEPSAISQDPQRRRQIQLLSWLLAFVIPLGLLSATIQLLTVSGFITTFLPILGAVVVLATAYGLNRFGRYIPAALLTVATPSGACLLSLLTNPADYAAFSFLLLSVLLGSMLLSLRGTVLVAAANMVGVVLLPVLTPAWSFAEVMGPLSLNVILPALIIVAMRHRDLVQKDRQEDIRQLELAVGNAMTGISRLDREGRFVMVKDLYARMLGYEPGELIGQSWEITVPPEDHAVCTEAFEAMLRTGRAEQECRARRKDGSVFYKHLLLVKTLDARGQHDGHYCFMRDVTVHQQAQETLLVVKERLHHLLTANPAVIYSAEASDPFGATFVSDNVTEQLGYAPEQFTDDPAFWMHHIHPEDTPRIIEGLSSLFEHDAHRHEYRFLHRNGTYRWMHDASKLVRNTAGDPVEMVGYWIDITERKQAEDALRESEQKYRQLVELAQEGIWVIDQDTNTIFVNASMARMLGYTPDEMQNKPLFSFMDEHGVALAKHNLARREQGITEQHEFEFLHKDGTPIYTLIETAPITDEDGNYLGAVAGIVDITERKHTQQALQKNEFLLSQAHRIARIGTWEWDVPGDSLYWSDETYHLLGLAPQSLTPDTATFLRYVHPDDLATVQDNMETLLQHGEAPPMEYRIVHDDGTMRWLFAEGEVSVDAQGQPVRMIGTVQDITDRKQAEETIRKNQNLLSLALRTAHAGAWEWDVKTNHVTWSNENYIVLGLAPGSCEATYDTWLRCVHPDDREKAQQHVAQALEKRQDLDIDYRITWPDGTIRWINDRGKLLLDEQAEPRHMYGFQIDITERKRAEDALKQQKEILQTIFDHIPLMIVFVDSEGRYLLVNQAYEQILGWTFEEIRNRTDLWAEFYPDPDERQKAIDSIKSQPRIWRDFKTTTRYGHVIDTSWANILLSDETSIGIGQDITERKRATEALQASEERNRALLDGIPDMMFRLRTDGTFLDYKAESAEELAMPPEAIIGNTLAESPLPAEIVDAIIQCVQQAMTTGEVQTYEYELGMPVGVQAYEARIVRSGADEVVSVVRNVTARKRAEAEQERLIEELEARNAELERFTYTVSHDLKTPLVTIKGFLGLLMQDVKAGNEEILERNVEHISNAADQMARLLNELLELARVGRVINPSHDIALTTLAHEAVELLGDQFNAHGITVTIDAEMPVVFGDRIRLLEVFQNLLENAVKFMGDQPKPQIKVGNRCDDGVVVYYVHDNGLGIPASYQEQIFGLFNRLDPAVDGTGIGLALVKRIVEVHGGRIWVESEGAGHGSTFCFTLPG